MQAPGAECMEGSDAKVGGVIFNAVDLHSQDLRHECACRSALHGVAICTIQYLTGHASIVTTER
jgi:integrase